MLGRILCAVALLAVGARGDHLFQWKFANNVSMPLSNADGSLRVLAQFVDQDFTECQTLPLLVESLFTNNTAAVGVPPYYLIAFEAGGIPTTTMIGSDPNNLSWQAIHKRGESLHPTYITLLTCIKGQH